MDLMGSMPWGSEGSDIKKKKEREEGVLATRSPWQLSQPVARDICACQTMAAKCKG
jgi:hypothetical protein